MTRFPTLVACLLLCATAEAHNRSESFSEWTWRGNEVSYTFSVLQREATRIPVDRDNTASLGSLLSDYLALQIVVSAGGQACVLERRPSALKSSEGYLHVEGSYLCGNEGTPTVVNNSFFDLTATHTHYSKFRHLGHVEEFLLTHDQRSRNFAERKTNDANTLGGWESFSQYLGVGVRHILSGADHLAFLLGLILLAGGWKEMAWLITGFTVGHSISLALAVLGVAQPNGVMVEALIGFTIALVAIEAAGQRNRQSWRNSLWLLAICVIALPVIWWVRPQWELVVGVAGAALFSLCYLQIVAKSKLRGALRLLVTLMFGVIHGFGFAGGLLEFEFPATQLAFVLFGFNLGVELGQLAVMLPVMFAVWVGGRLADSQWHERAANVTVTSLSAVGTFWFVSRLIT